MTATSALHTYSSDEILRDGGSVHLRAITPHDKPRLLALLHSITARSVYYRFFASKKTLSDDELTRFTELDFCDRVALAATTGSGEQERIIAVGRYARLPAHPHRADVAFAVADQYQGRGIGTLLLERLADIARAAGITELQADVLGENNAMLRVFESSGFALDSVLDDGIFTFRIATRETPAHQTAADQRLHAAAVSSIGPLLAPGSVALVGASRRAGSVGAILWNNLRHGFRGDVYPVNPHTQKLDGVPCFARVSAIGQPIDLVVIAVPAAVVPDVVADCERAGAHGLLVISAGFAETGDEGREVQQHLVHRVRAGGMRMVGPNCLGLLNTNPLVALNATFATIRPSPGSISMVSQRGALGLAILDESRARNLGVASFVSVGNKADVSSNDLLEYWQDDPRTEVILLYLESFGNPRRFARLARQIARTKPIVAMKSGRSAAGTRAASSHSAALANQDVAVDALFAHTGVVRTATLQELFDVAALLSTQPLPRGNRIAVVTNAGGPGVLLADACEAHGLTLPEPGADTLAALREVVPASSGLTNPIDVTAGATPEQYAAALAAMGRDPEVDAVVAIYIPALATSPDHMAGVIAEAAGGVPADKPVLAVFLWSGGPPAALSGGPRGALPAYTFPENAALALGHAVRYGRWRAQPPGQILELSELARAAVRGVVDRALAAAPEPAWMSPVDVAALLRAAGITTAASEVCDPAETRETAERLGYPLVAKLVSRDVVHKTDMGGVVLGLRSGAEVARATAQLLERADAAGARVDGIMVQREVAAGIEAIVGVTTDPIFGALIACGLGGTLVEIYKDVGFRMPPLSNTDAAALIDSLRARTLLDGHRGQPPADIAALRELIQRVAALTDVVPEIAELDLNPVKVLSAGDGAVVVDARVRLAPPA